MVSNKRYFFLKEKLEGPQIYSPTLFLAMIDLFQFALDEL